MKKPTIIGIAGGTASGKTTIAKKLYDASSTIGSVALIRMDDYYRGYQYVPLNEHGARNFDHPDSYDTKLIVSDLEKLTSGKPIDKPTYDFVHSVRTDKTERIDPSDVIIFEGIMAFAIPALRRCFDIKIFVDTPDDIRFIRRLTRDIERRGRTVDSVVNQYLESVRPMHQAFVDPSKKWADIIIPEGGHNDVAIDVLVTKIETLLTKQS